MNTAPEPIGQAFTPAGRHPRTHTGIVPQILGASCLLGVYLYPRERRAGYKSRDAFTGRRRSHVWTAPQPVPETGRTCTALPAVRLRKEKEGLPPHHPRTSGRGLAGAASESRRRRRESRRGLAGHVLCDAADRCGGTSEPRRGARRASTPRLGRRRYGPGRVDRIARARRPVPSQRHPGDKREQHPQQTAAPAVVLLLHPFQIIVCLIFYFKFDNSFYSKNLYKYY